MIYKENCKLWNAQTLVQVLRITVSEKVQKSSSGTWCPQQPEAIHRDARTHSRMRKYSVTVPVRRPNIRLEVFIWRELGRRGGEGRGGEGRGDNFSTTFQNVWRTPSDQTYSGHITIVTRQQKVRGEIGRTRAKSDWNDVVLVPESVDVRNT
jgi:hypothetical protein